MSEKCVEITVGQTGEVKIDALGFQGVGCKDATARIQVALNGTVKKDDTKPEYYATSQTSAKLMF